MEQRPSPASQLPMHQVQPSPKQFLLDTPRGAYTTLWVQRSLNNRGSNGSSTTGEDEASGAAHGAPASTQQLQLVDWGTHLERLVRSLRAMHAALDGCYARYYSWLETASDPEQAALQRLMAPAIRAALAAAQHAHAAAQHLMLIIVLPPAPESASGLDVRALACPCAAPGCTPCSALVLGGPRSVPEGKDSGWVAERQPLEAARSLPPAEQEVLLCTADGRLLEGLVTNLFVVTYGEPATAEGPTQGGVSDGEQPTAAPALAKPVVWTAGVHDGVVWGTMRVRVLEACRALGYAVREEAPSMHSRHEWREAFLTNSMRLVQPLRSIACADANVWGLPAWHLDLLAAPGPITSAIAAAVRAALPACPVSDL